MKDYMDIDEKSSAEDREKLMAILVGHDIAMRKFLGAPPPLSIEEVYEPVPNDDICGLCGEPGADKMAHPMHWPGEQIPDGPLVHSECEAEECRRAHAELTPAQREAFLRTI